MYLKPLSTASVTTTEPGGELLGEPQRADDVRAGRDPGEDSLFAREAERHRDRLVVLDRPDVVDAVGVPVRRHDARPALHRERAARGRR